ncbi:MAG: N-acetyltransferase family protein [Candidatus Nanohaloarchaea archaeon]
MHTREDLDATRFSRMSTGDIDRIGSALAGRDTAPRGVNPAYLKEIVACDITDVFFTGDDTVENVFHVFYLEDTAVVEDWGIGAAYRESIQEIVDAHPRGEIRFALDNRDTGRDLGWTFQHEAGEMKRGITGTGYSDSCPRFRDEHLDGAVRLLSQDWWTPAQARDFIEAATGHSDGITVVTVDDGRVTGFNHAAYSGEDAWMNALYVDEEYREAGRGRRLLKSMLARLQEDGVRTVYLGITKSNDPAVNLYTESGFEFTDFRKFEFSVNQET